ncbi:MAG: phage portal protein, partial [Bradyrhizobium sp.]|nr:phage portal protein [Bradyrhizobium sp.]
RERGVFFVEHKIEGLLRGDTKARTDYYTSLWDRGVLSADEIRALENLNPQDGGHGDTYYVPLNYAPAGTEPSRTFAQGGEPAPARAEQRTVARNRRQQIQATYREPIAKELGRLFRQERHAITQKAGQVFGERSDVGDFLAWLGDYYTDRQSYVADEIRPVFGALARAVGIESMAEVGQDWPGLDGDLRDWIDGYIERFAEDLGRMSAGQLRLALAEPDIDPLTAITQRLDEWVHGLDGGRTRAEKIASSDVVKIGQKFSVEAFAAAGVTALIWRASGSDTCPYCQALNGKVVGVREAFVDKGGWQPDGADHVMDVQETIRSPPCHAGCDCR